MNGNITTRLPPIAMIGLLVVSLSVLAGCEAPPGMIGGPPEEIEPPDNNCDPVNVAKLNRKSNLTNPPIHQT